MGVAQMGSISLLYSKDIATNEMNEAIIKYSGKASNLVYIVSSYSLKAVRANLNTNTLNEKNTFTFSEFEHKVRKQVYAKNDYITKTDQRFLLNKIIEKRYVDTEKYEAMKSIQRDLFKLFDFLDYLKGRIEAQPEEDEAEIDEKSLKKGVVTVMTIHKAKGLSLPVVIIPYIDRSLLNQSNAPDFAIDQQKKLFALNDILKTKEEMDSIYLEMVNNSIIKLLEEELRVLYVAMTRAEHILILCNNRDQGSLQKSLISENYVSWCKWIG